MFKTKTNTNVSTLPISKSLLCYHSRLIKEYISSSQRTHKLMKILGLLVFQHKKTCRYILNISKRTLKFFQEKVRCHPIIIQNVFHREYLSFIFVSYHKFIFICIMFQGRRKRQKSNDFGCKKFRMQQLKWMK